MKKKVAMKVHVTESDAPALNMRETKFLDGRHWAAVHVALAMRLAMDEPEYKETSFSDWQYASGRALGAVFAQLSLYGRMKALEKWVPGYRVNDPSAVEASLSEFNITRAMFENGDWGEADAQGKRLLAEEGISLSSEFYVGFVDGVVGYIGASH